ncbi:CPBP family intramembrane metalloprotease [Polaribacter batillariae]|uniref:CPBP family intramembrane metalloprotease n=1 Tax=Polaribacter batillariae TaxID=2808900 RepID=A0ABX7SVZ8_9FLAO|nr:CPBP family intramembrane glutamic endopeptidase [Polaribacter batillariae]QTD38424.1 CPBP family intramembrane metalloprotease [Polaribacter batillariae]
MINYFLKLKRRNFLIYVFLIPILWNILISITLVYFFDINLSDHKGVPDYSLYTYIFISVFFAPLYETLVYQFFTIEFFRLLFEKIHKPLLILISGFLFGFMHYFNANSYLYSLLAFIMGLFFAFIYEVSKIRKDIKSHFFLVALVHSSVNLSGSIVSLLIGIIIHYFSQ